MRRFFSKAITIMAIVALGALLPVTAASASTTRGPYPDEGTCNYWMNAVRAAGYNTSDCYVPCGIGCTAPNGDTRWYFAEN
jgi:hypothetical protein